MGLVLSLVGGFSFGFWWLGMVLLGFVLSLATGYGDG